MNKEHVAHITSEINRLYGKEIADHVEVIDIDIGAGSEFASVLLDLGSYGRVRGYAKRHWKDRPREKVALSVCVANAMKRLEIKRLPHGLSRRNLAE